jgi:cell division protein FtsW
MSLISRSDRGLVARWWFTVDWALMSAILILMAAGVMISMAASPPVAARIGLDPMHFVKSQLFYVVFAFIGLITLSFFSETWIRRLGVLVFVGSIVAMIAALFVGPEIKGAHRWLDVGPISIQPSEFAKPSFVIVFAWLIAEHLRRPDMPARNIAYAAAAVFIGLLVLQPDFGQAFLVSLTLGCMLLIAGLSWVVAAVLLASGAGAIVLAYSLVPHVASRIDRFLYPDKGDSFQIDTALEAFGRGGVVGTGPGGGQAKLVLPDAHTDFTLAVIGEEYGLVACLVLVALFFFAVMLIFIRAKRQDDVFPALALSGLGTLFGLQACINMGVNVSLLPAKGMTLPFISYGGSSLLGSALAMGFVLALGRSAALNRRVTSYSLA